MREMHFGMLHINGDKNRRPGNTEAGYFDIHLHFAYIFRSASKRARIA